MKTIIAVTASAVAIVAFNVGTAQASIPPGTYHGCLNYTHNRTIDHVYTVPQNGTTCPTGETQLIWPAGPDSDPAPPPPPPVTAGSAGLDVIVVQNSATVSFPDGTFLDVQCPADHPYVINGGGFIQDNAAALRDSYPVVPGPGGQFPQAWEVGFTFPAAITGGGVTSATATAYAECSK